jgi:hypothetical protein
VTSARLRIRYADGRIADRILREGTYVVGRESGDIMLLDPNVSGKHAELQVRPGSVVLLDCGSTNGTWDAAGARITGLHTRSPYRLPDVWRQRGRRDERH